MPTIDRGLTPTQQDLQCLKAAINDPEALERVLVDDNHVWDYVLHEIEVFEKGLPPLPMVAHFDEFQVGFGRQIILAAARRLRGMGFRHKVNAVINLRIARACKFSAILQGSNSPAIVHLALKRECTVASWLLSLPSKYHKTLKLNVTRVAEALCDLANQANPAAARAELSRYDLRVHELAPPQRNRESRPAVILPRLINFSHAILFDDGIELNGEEIAPAFVQLDRRHVRVLIAAWFLSFAVKFPGGNIPNGPQFVSFRREQLELLIGKAASRTNLNQLRRIVVFEGLEFLVGTPPTSIVPISLGFSKINDLEFVTCKELDLIASRYDVNIGARLKC